MRRALGLEPNRLRRRSDRVEATVLVLLVAVFVLAGPLLTVAAAGSAYESARRAELPQAARHHVAARLVTGAAWPRPPFVENGPPPRVLAAARWEYAGVSHTGRVRVPAGSRAGSAVLVWVDGSGRLADAPGTRAGTIGLTVLAGSGCALGLGFSLLATRRFVRWTFVRRRLPEWEAEWAAVASEWTRRR